MSFSINQLKENNLLSIFTCLNIRELSLVARVCRMWNIVASCNEIWKRWNIFKDTPSPVKHFTIMLLQGEVIPLIQQAKLIPQELPKYDSDIVYSTVSLPSTWQTYAVPGFEIYTSGVGNAIKNEFDVLRLLSRVAKAFSAIISYHAYGITSLDEAKELIEKTVATFRNPYPFIVLKEEYAKKGDVDQANKMQQMANDLIQNSLQEDT